MEAASTTAAPSRARVPRKTYLIDRGFQLKYTLMLVVVGAFISALFGGMMYLAHLDAQRAMNPPEGLNEQLAKADATLIWLMVSITVLMASAFGLFGILITHRVAGPVYVMSHYISILARGRYPIMRPLRKKDELKVFFHRFQDAVETMRLREVEEAEALKEALAALESFAGNPDAQRTLNRLRAIHDRKRDATDRVAVSVSAAGPPA